MQGFEYATLGGALLLSVALLLVCLLRFVAAKPAARPQGRASNLVEVERLGWTDLAGVGLVFVIYLGNWIDLGREAAAEPVTYELLFSQLLLQVAFIGVVLGVFYKRVPIVAFWGLKPIRYWWVIAVVFAGFVFHSILLELLWLLGFQDWAKFAFWRMEGAPVEWELEADLSYWVLWGVISVVGAPLMEEVVFRGYLYPVLKKMGGTILAAFTVSLFFAAAHLEGVHFVDRMLLSLILIAAYEMTGTIWAPFGIHFLNNFYVFLGNFLEK